MSYSGDDAVTVKPIAVAFASDTGDCIQPFFQVQFLEGPERRLKRKVGHRTSLENGSRLGLSDSKPYDSSGERMTRQVDNLNEAVV